MLYTSLGRDTALAEVYFHLSRQPVFPSVPFQIHRIRAHARKILRLDEMTLLRQLGVDTDKYATMDYARTQAIGDAAFFLGFEGLIVPSARSSALNLVLFLDRLEATDTEVEDSESIDWQSWRRLRG